MLEPTLAPKRGRRASGSLDGLERSTVACSPNVAVRIATSPRAGRRQASHAHDAVDSYMPGCAR